MLVVMEKEKESEELVFLETLVACVILFLFNLYVIFDQWIIYVDI